jgi:hypothetical protein
MDSDRLVLRQLRGGKGGRMCVQLRCTAGAKPVRGHAKSHQPSISTLGPFQDGPRKSEKCSAWRALQIRTGKVRGASKCLGGENLLCMRGFGPPYGSRVEMVSTSPDFTLQKFRPPRRRKAKPETHVLKSLSLSFHSFVPGKPTPAPESCCSSRRGVDSRWIDRGKAVACSAHVPHSVDLQSLSRSKTCLDAAGRMHRTKDAICRQPIFLTFCMLSSSKPKTEACM